MEDEIRLLVMSKHDERLSPHIGSRLETVVRTMHRGILVCSATFKAPQRVMLAFDGSATARKGVEMVAGSPMFRGLPCHLVMVGADDANHREQLAWAQKILEAAGFEAPVSIRAGDVVSGLSGYAHEHGIDLVIMGAYGHSVIRRFLVGSTTTSMILKSSVPVLLLR
jgi:nucleotide-binding universal stress UspA family protein